MNSPGIQIKILYWMNVRMVRFTVVGHGSIFFYRNKYADPLDLRTERVYANWEVPCCEEYLFNRSCPTCFQQVCVCNEIESDGSD